MEKIMSFCFGLCFISAHGQAQFTARVDSLNMLIGDQQTLVFNITSPAGINPSDIHTEFLDTCKFLEIITQSTWTRSEGNQLILQEKNIRFGIFDEGHFVIPACFAIHRNDTFWTYPIPIDVRGIEPDSTGLMPIKGIVLEKPSWTDYLAWLIGAGVLLIGYLIYLYYKKVQANKLRKKTEIPEIVLLPHELALQKLQGLKQSRLWEHGEVKEFHVQLTYILREYLEGRFNFPALESTTNEIEKAIQTLGLHADQITQVHNLLHVADWVKFARGRPEENANSVALDQAIDLVTRTIPGDHPSPTTEITA